MNRRQFLRWGWRSVAAAPFLLGGYGLFEAGWFRIARLTIAVPNLPPAFENLSIAFLTDLHHGRWTSLHYIRTVVQVTNSLAPDLILLGGDYAYASAKYLAPCLEVLAGLQAPLGKFGVLGNHDHWYDAKLTRTEMHKACIADVSNGGYWLLSGGERLRIGGVDDFWEGVQDLDAAMGDAGPSDACLLLSHNPDYVEGLTDRRPGLVLSGHTHGGQVVLPGNYAPWVPSYYGTKYLHGLVQTEFTQVYVSRGLATTGPPVRFCARPEILMVTLTSGRAAHEVCGKILAQRDRSAPRTQRGEPATQKTERG